MALFHAALNREKDSLGSQRDHRSSFAGANQQTKRP
jgi:hypothetical protein